jgi:hypothetical protein
MNQSLSKINEIYLEIQDYVDPLLDDLIHMDRQLLDKLKINRIEALDKYETTQKLVIELLPTLSRDEIIQGYMEGCRLLQRNLSGFMGKNYNKDYATVMENAIREGHYHTAWLFLQVLSDNSESNLMSLLEFSLRQKALQEVALGIVENLKLKELLPIIRELKDSQDDEINSIAQKVYFSLSQ